MVHLPHPPPWPRLRRPWTFHLPQRPITRRIFRICILQKCISCTLAQRRSILVYIILHRPRICHRCHHRPSPPPCRRRLPSPFYRTQPYLWVHDHCLCRAGPLCPAHLQMDLRGGGGIWVGQRVWISTVGHSGGGIWVGVGGGGGVVGVVDCGYCAINQTCIQ